MISFLNKDNDNKNTQQGPIAKGDIIFLIVIAVVGIGIYLYSTRVKDVSYEQFDACIASYEADKLLEAQECFDEARELHFINDSLDNLIYIYTSKLNDIEIAERSLFSKMEEYSAGSNDKVMQKILQRLPEKLYFLSPTQMDSISGWKGRFLAPETASDSLATTPGDSTGSSADSAAVDSVPIAD